MSKTAPPKMPHPKYEAIFIRVPKEIEQLGPPIANEVSVTGGIDCATVELFHVPSGKWLDATMRGTDVESYHDPKVGILRVAPVARFAIPFNVAAELVAKLIEAAADGAEDLQAMTPDVLRRMDAAAKRIQAAFAPPSATDPVPPTEAS